VLAAAVGSARNAVGGAVDSAGTGVGLVLWVGARGAALGVVMTGAGVALSSTTVHVDREAVGPALPAGGAALGEMAGMQPHNAAMQNATTGRSLAWCQARERDGAPREFMPGFSHIERARASVRGRCRPHTRPYTKPTLLPRRRGRRGRGWGHARRGNAPGVSGTPGPPVVGEGTGVGFGRPLVLWMKQLGAGRYVPCACPSSIRVPFASKT
jgi:hypothetical protein